MKGQVAELREGNHEYSWEFRAKGEPYKEVGGLQGTQSPQGSKTRWGQEHTQVEQGKKRDTFSFEA